MIGNGDGVSVVECSRMASWLWNGVPTNRRLSFWLIGFHFRVEQRLEGFEICCTPNYHVGSNTANFRSYADALQQIGSHEITLQTH